MSSTKLDALRGELARRGTRAWLVIRNDRIVDEWYAEGQDGKKQGTASLAKALVGGVSLGVAISDGKLRWMTPPRNTFRSGRSDPQKSQITVRHLGSHTSGIKDAEENGLPHEKLTGWKGDFWKRLPPPNDPFTWRATRRRCCSIQARGSMQQPWHRHADILCYGGHS